LGLGQEPKKNEASKKEKKCTTAPTVKTKKLDTKNKIIGRKHTSVSSNKHGEKIKERKIKKKEKREKKKKQRKKKRKKKQKKKRNKPPPSKKKRKRKRGGSFVCDLFILGATAWKKNNEKAWKNSWGGCLFTAWRDKKQKKSWRRRISKNETGLWGDTDGSLIKTKTKQFRNWRPGNVRDPNACGG